MLHLAIRKSFAFWPGAYAWILVTWTCKIYLLAMLTMLMSTDMSILLSALSSPKTIRTHRHQTQHSACANVQVPSSDPCLLPDALTERP